MKRWNGWGEESISMPLPSRAKALLRETIGPGRKQSSCDIQSVAARVPQTGLPASAPADTDPTVRVLHARGQSTPDWIALRSGNISTFPDGVAFPENSRDLQRLLDFANDSGAVLIPYGGGTSVLGHINPLALDRPIITVSLSRMNALLHVDETSRLATFQAGILGPDLEAGLKSKGLTLGHFPQSFQYSTLGGWVATRSSGQQSLGYGRIDDLFQGGLLHTPRGRLHLPAHPASAAGPAIQDMVLGSEGRMGILSEVTVQVRPLPEMERFHGLVLPNWETAVSAVRGLVQEEIPLSMLRLSNAEETQSQLALSGQDRMSDYLFKYMRLRGIDPRAACMLLVGFTGTASRVRHGKRQAISLLKNRHGALHLHRFPGNSWARNRFRAPYLRNTLWEEGYAVDTLETAVTWDIVTQTMRGMEQALRRGLEEEEEGVHAFSHLSHFYPTGASIYTTYIFRVASSPEETHRRWRKLKHAASRVIVENQGTISHHHGVGTDHRDYLRAEKGELGVSAIKALCEHFDPRGIMNPGKLV
ncbi:MAG: FAD-binding oxidoreductase [Desulfohalobiaceae bacterium]|nr:FAD-binding oxidoreductase [Desulfohalobiaceae bacterium]